MEENLVDVYLDRVTRSERPGYSLAEFFCRFYGIETIPKEYILYFAKMTTAYGRQRVFMAICDTMEVDQFNAENPYGLITYFIKRRVEDSFSSPVTYINTKGVQDRVEKAKGRKRKLKIRNPFEHE